MKIYLKNIHIYAMLCRIDFNRKGMPDELSED